MKEFIEYIVKNLVDSPKNVSVDCHQTERGFLIRLRVSHDDIGKVVGRKGMTIKAIRTIIMSVCARLGHRVELELTE
jgi:predicted RNA-binding protein YlqC (UPF0109 family)